MMQPVIDRIMPYRKRIVIGQFFKFTEVILELIVPLLIARMVDQGIVANNISLIVRYTVFSLILAVSGMFCAYVCQYNASVASQGYGTDLRNDLYAHILLLSESEIHRFGSASLTTRITSDIQVLQHAMAMFIRLIPRAPFICLGCIVMVYMINPGFIGLFLIAVLIFILILFFLIKTILPMINRTQRLTDRLTGRLLELLEGIRVIRAVSRSEEKAKQYCWTNEDLEKMMRKIGKVSSLMNPLTMLALNLIAVALLWLSGAQIKLGALHSGEIIALINYLTMLLTALTVLSNLVLLYTRAYASALRVGEVLKTEQRPRNPQITASSEAVEPERSQPKLNKKSQNFVSPRAPEFSEKRNAISFEDVDFAYPNSGTLLFRKLSFALPISKTLGIIGPTGSGKSSLGYLLEKRYPIKSGRINLFDQNLDSYSEPELLNLLQIVPQSTSLFSGTLRDSLTIGMTNVTDAEIWQALRIAQAEDFVVQNEQGLFQKVERGGKNFSGGQRQRLSIARALLRKSKILIFDDCSSALDLATDAALQKAIRNDLDFADTCLITISQRIATVKKSDFILLLDNGIKAGFGSHEQLLEENKLYKEIYQSQTEVTEAEIDYLRQRSLE